MIDLIENIIATITAVSFFLFIVAIIFVFFI